MISGSKNNSRIKSKGKQKMALAKDSKQLFLAIGVMCLFIGTTIHSIAQYIQPPSPAPINTTTQQPSQINLEDTVNATPPVDPTVNPGQPGALNNPIPGETATRPNQINTPGGPNQAVIPNNTNPIIPPNDPNQVGAPGNTNTMSAAGNPNQPGMPNPANPTNSPNGPNTMSAAENPNPAASLNNPEAISEPKALDQSQGLNNPIQNIQQTISTVPLQNVSPVLPIIMALLLIGAVVVAVKYFSGNKMGKQNLAITKNSKPLYIAIGVICLLLVATISTIAHYYQAQNQITQMNANMAAISQNPTQQQWQSPQQDADNIYSQTLNLQANQPNKNASSLVSPLTPNSSGDEIEILTKKKVQAKSEKMVSIVVDNSGRPNPFLPEGENIGISKSSKTVVLPYLTAPPETLPTDSDAGKVMTTTISGILYDKYSPSAIINIEGSDYLVKKGDIINRYKILSIGKTQVLVQLGKNVYQAGVGELLSRTDLNFNTIANLNKKFGGNDVSINVRKKGK